jgi:hypothetical protein
MSAAGVFSCVPLNPAFLRINSAEGLALVIRGYNIPSAVMIASAISPSFLFSF